MKLQEMTALAGSLAVGQTFGTLPSAFPGSGPTRVKSECPGALGHHHLCVGGPGLSSVGLGVSPAQAGGAGPSSTCLCGPSQSVSTWDLPSSLPLEVLTLAPSPILLGFLCLSLSAAL